MLEWSQLTPEHMKAAQLIIIAVVALFLIWVLSPNGRG
jgi:hypothetical protein